MNRKSATFCVSIFIVLLGFQTAFAQNIGYLGRTHSLTIKGIQPFSANSCNLEITLPDGEKVEKEVNAPDFETKVDFVPKSVGRNLIEWEGKLKLRGFTPILGCTGGGKIFVEVTYPKQAQLDEKDLELLANARQLFRDKKINEAFDIFRQLAEKGHAQSQAFVAAAYYRGEGTTRNFAEAFKWAILAAETEAYSMHLLGIMYFNGYGVKQDCDLAVKYYKSAIEKNEVNAMLNLGRAYLMGRCVKSDPAEAKILLDRAASVGNAGAMFTLGGMYERGVGVEKDERLAIDWYRKASDKGDEAAKKELARMEAAEALAAKDRQRIQAEQLAKKEEEERNARWLSSPEYKKQQLEIAKQEQERLERQRLADERKVVEDQRRLQQQEIEENEKCCRSIFFQTRQAGDAQRWVGDPIISILYLKALSGTHVRTVLSEDGLIQVNLNISPNGIASLWFSREVINLPKEIRGTWQSNNGKLFISFENKWSFQAEYLSRLFRNPNERYPRAPSNLFLQSNSAPFFLSGEYLWGGEVHLDPDKKIHVDASRYQNPSNVLPKEYERKFVDEQKRQQQLEIARREQVEKDRLERQRITSTQPTSVPEATATVGRQQAQVQIPGYPGSVEPMAWCKSFLESAVRTIKDSGRQNNLKSAYDTNDVNRMEAGAKYLAREIGSMQLAPVQWQHIVAPKLMQGGIAGREYSTAFDKSVVEQCLDLTTEIDPKRAEVYRIRNSIQRIVGGSVDYLFGEHIVNVENVLRDRRLPNAEELISYDFVSKINFNNKLFNTLEDIEVEVKKYNSPEQEKLTKDLKFIRENLKNTGHSASDMRYLIDKAYTDSYNKWRFRSGLITPRVNEHLNLMRRR